MQPGVVPATNWLAALLPYFANPDVAGVGGPVLPRADGNLRARIAAAVYESRFAAGPVARRHLPGNLRRTADQPLDNLLMRRAPAIASGALADAAARRNDGDVCRMLGTQGQVWFTPEAPVVASMPALVRPLLAQLHSHARARGKDMARGRRAPIATAAPTALTVGLVALPALHVLPRPARQLAAGVVTLYAVGLAYAATHAGLRHRSFRVTAGSRSPHRLRTSPTGPASCAGR